MGLVHKKEISLVFLGFLLNISDLLCQLLERVFEI